MLHKDPLMRTMIGLHHYLELMKIEITTGNKGSIDSLIKIEILDMIDFYINLRKNYLISNFMAFFHIFKTKARAKQFPNEEKLYEYMLTKIGHNINAILPNIPRIGIYDIDHIKKQKLSISKVMSKIVEKKLISRASFYDFILDEDERVPDFDMLLANHEHLLSKRKTSIIATEFSPSLILIFWKARDEKLSHRALDIMMRFYSQRKELMHSLKELEVIFGSNQMHVYNSLKIRFNELLISAESIEVTLLIYY